MPWSWVNTEYSIHLVQHKPSTANTEHSINQWWTVSLSQPVCHLSSLGWPCCTLLSTLPGLQVIKWIESQHASCLPIEHLQIEHLQVLLHFRSIMVSKGISQFRWSPSRSVSPYSLHHDLQVRNTTASKCISKLGESCPSSASPNFVNLSLQMVLKGLSICVARWYTDYARVPSAARLVICSYIVRLG